MSLPAAGAPAPDPPDASAPPDPSLPTHDMPAPPVRASVDDDVFRRVVGHFAAGITVVTTELDGVDHAMTASAFTSVSLDPLLVLVCVDKEARFRDAVLESGVWGVSILSGSSRRAAEWFATKGRPLIGQLDRFPHHRGPATRVPLLGGALAWLECRNRAVYDGGDHDIVLGEVVEAGLDDRDAPPLIYFRGHYGQLP